MNESRLRYEAVLNVPVSDNIGSRAGRRRKVIALYGSYIVLCAAQAVAAVPNLAGARVAAGILLMSGIAGLAYGVVSLMGRTFVNAPNIRESALDERQRQRRNAAMAQSFPINGMFLALCLVYAMIANTLVPAWRNAGVTEALFWGAFLLAVSLPSAIIAWTEPDPLPPDAAS